MDSVADMWSEASQARARAVLEALALRGDTVATAESLTGGLLAARLTDVPGASRSFVGGVVAYATRLKISTLGVAPELVERHGVVSRECAEAMAGGVRDRLGATWGLATTGVAGPDPQEGHGAGTVWVAVAGPDLAETRLLALAGDRLTIREATTDAVLSVLGGMIIGEIARDDPGLG